MLVNLPRIIMSTLNFIPLFVTSNLRLITLPYFEVLAKYWWKREGDNMLHLQDKIVHTSLLVSYCLHYFTHTPKSYLLFFLLLVLSFCLFSKSTIKRGIWDFEEDQGRRRHFLSRRVGEMMALYGIVAMEQEYTC